MEEYVQPSQLSFLSFFKECLTKILLHNSYSFREPLRIIFKQFNFLVYSYYRFIEQLS